MSITNVRNDNIWEVRSLVYYFARVIILISSCRCSRDINFKSRIII